MWHLSTSHGEDELIGPCRGTCCTLSQLPYLCVSLSHGTRKLFVCMWDSRSSLNTFQVQASCEAWKVLSWSRGWGLETSPLLCVLPSSSRPFSEVRWCGRTYGSEIWCNMDYSKECDAQHSPQDTPAISVFCLVNITFVPKTQSEVLVNSSRALFLNKSAEC